MANKKSTTKLTFALTIEQPEGMTIKDARQMIIDGVLSIYPKLHTKDTVDVKCHLLNKETSYGKR